IFDRPQGEIVEIREEIVRRIGASLKAPIRENGNVPIDLEAFQLFMRGQISMTKLTQESIENAREIFSRATVLYPRFARAYLGLGQSLLLIQSPAEKSLERHADATRALERALELDPDLGEALNDLASITDDPQEAESMFLRSLELAPSYDLGYYKYN